MGCSHTNVSLFSVCAECGELVLPSAQINDFELFKIQPRYFIDQDAVQKKFYEYSKTLHPDRFQNKSPEKLMAATSWFARLNKALKTLKSDTDRAEHLFELSGFKPALKKSSLPPDMAEDYFNLQENLEDDAISAPDKALAFKEFAKLIDDKIKESHERREAVFHDWEKAGAPLTLAQAQPYFEKIAFELNQRAYLVSMSQDLEKKCQTLL